MGWARYQAVCQAAYSISSGRESSSANALTWRMVARIFGAITEGAIRPKRLHIGPNQRAVRGEQLVPLMPHGLIVVDRRDRARRDPWDGR